MLTCLRLYRKEGAEVGGEAAPARGQLCAELPPPAHPPLLLQHARRDFQAPPRTLLSRSYSNRKWQER